MGEAPVNPVSSARGGRKAAGHAAVCFSPTCYAPRSFFTASHPHLLVFRPHPGPSLPFTVYLFPVLTSCVQDGPRHIYLGWSIHAPSAACVERNARQVASQTMLNDRKQEPLGYITDVLCGVDIAAAALGRDRRAGTPLVSFPRPHHRYLFASSHLPLHLPVKLAAHLIDDHRSRRRCRRRGWRWGCRGRTTTVRLPAVHKEPNRCFVSRNFISRYCGNTRSDGDTEYPPAVAAPARLKLEDSRRKTRQELADVITPIYPSKNKTPCIQFYTLSE